MKGLIDRRTSTLKCIIERDVGWILSLRDDALESIRSKVGLRFSNVAEDYAF